MKILLHFNDGKTNEISPAIAKMLAKVINVNELISDPSGQKKALGKFLNLDGLYSVEIVL